MRIIIKVKEIGGKIDIEAKLDTGCRDTARERTAGEALFHHLGDHFATMEQTAEKPGRWERVKALFGGKRAK